MLSDGEKPEILTYGGFYQPGGYTSNILAYDLTKGDWSFLYEDSNVPAPAKRAAASLAILGSNLYMFGGTNVQVRFSDFWKFDLQ